MSGTNALTTSSDLSDPGKKVLLPEPYFPLYGPDATLVGGSPTYYPCRFEHEFVPQIDDLEALVDSDTTAILYNFSPIQQAEPSMQHNVTPCSSSPQATCGSSATRCMTASSSKVSTLSSAQATTGFSS